jgi:hypothetical protein
MVVKRRKGSKQKRLSRGFRKYIRKQKSEIRREILDTQIQKEELEKLDKLKEEILRRFKNVQNSKNSIVV